MRKITCLSSFILKIVALLTMTFDHVGLMLGMLYPTNTSILQVAEVFRIIGRLALPLFVFMIVEGVIHTKDFKKYILRLGIMAGIIMFVFILAEYWIVNIKPFPVGETWVDPHELTSLLRAGNIFMDLTLVALSIYLLKQKEIWKKLLTLLPLMYSILSFVVKGLEVAGPMYIHWFPCFLTMQYDWFSIVLGLGFYASYYLADSYIKMLEPSSGIDKSIWEANGNYRLLVNIISLFVVLVVNFLYYCTKFYWPNGVYWDIKVELYSIISGALILLYNGKRGYNAKWFQYGSYLYYPLHLIIIAVIYISLSGGF